MSVNKVILLGRLGQDPETKQTQGGTTVCRLSVATSERVKKGDAWEEHTEWHRVVLFGKTAENADRFLVKGREVYIEGRLRTNKWQDKEGNDRWTTEVLGDVVQFIGGRDAGSAGAAPSKPGKPSKPSGEGSRRAAEPPPDDDMPF